MYKIKTLNEFVNESINSRTRAKIVVLLKKSGLINTEDYTYATGTFLANDIETANDMADALGDKYKVAIHDDKITKDGKVPMMITESLNEAIRYKAGQSYSKMIDGQVHNIEITKILPNGKFNGISRTRSSAPKQQKPNIIKGGDLDTWLDGYDTLDESLNEARFTSAKSVNVDKKILKEMNKELTKKDYVDGRFHVKREFIIEKGNLMVKTIVNSKKTSPRELIRHTLHDGFTGNTKYAEIDNGDTYIEDPKGKLQYIDDASGKRAGSVTDHYGDDIDKHNESELHIVTYTTPSKIYQDQF